MDDGCGVCHRSQAPRLHSQKHQSLLCASLASEVHFVSGVNDSKAIDVAAGIIFRNGKLLVTRRRIEDHLGGLWEFPGGKRLPHESHETCLKRELGEELGITVTPIETVDSVLHRYPEKLVSLRFIRCLLIEGEPTPIQCDAIAWITQDQIDLYDFPEADNAVIEKIRKTSEWWRV